MRFNKGFNTLLSKITSLQKGKPVKDNFYVTNVGARQEGDDDELEMEIEIDSHVVAASKQLRDTAL